ncbi:MAG: hypothetical protein ABDH18_03080 [Aquificaceae bacterium]
MRAILVYFFSAGILLAQTKECENPLKRNELCKAIWPVCKTLAIKRLNAIQECIRQSKSYEEGTSCFERSILRDIFSLAPP